MKLSPAPSHYRPAALATPPSAPTWIEFDELEEDEAGARDLLRLIEAHGAIPAGRWEFDIH